MTKKRSLEFFRDKMENFGVKSLKSYEKNFCWEKVELRKRKRKEGNVKSRRS